MNYQDQIVMLKQAKQGIKVDTVYHSNDTLFIDLNNKTTIAKNATVQRVGISD